MSVELRAVLDSIPVYRPGESPDECTVENAIKLSSNECPWNPPEDVCRAIRDAIPTLNRYPDYYKEQLCADLAAVYGVDPGQIAVDNGSGTLLQDLVRIVCDDGDEVLYCAPTFPAYQIDVELAGAIPRVLPLDGDYRFDLDALARAVTPKTRMVLICNPNNPTGTYLTADELDAFIGKLPGRVLVGIDEAYHEFEREEPLDASLALVRKWDNVVLLRTYSKALGLAGMRIGYCITRDYLVDAINKTIAEFSVSTLAQAAARACLEEGAARELERRTQEIVDVRERFERGLAENGIDFIPSSSNFIMLPRPDAMETFELLKSQGIITRPQEDPCGVRITVGTAEQMQRVAAALGFSLE